MKMLETIHKSIIIYMDQASGLSSFKLLYKIRIYKICNSTCDLIPITLSDMVKKCFFTALEKQAWSVTSRFVENLKVMKNLGNYLNSEPAHK